MKTKREILEAFVTYSDCKHIKCEDCSYNINNNFDCKLQAGARLSQIGAMAILRQNRKKREFDTNKVLTCVTADKAEVGMNGHFADCLADIKSQFNTKHIRTLSEIRDEEAYERFIDQAGTSWALFYPIDEVEE